MARFLLFLFAAAFIGACSAVLEDCEIPPPVQYATIQIRDEEDFIRVFYTCQTGYELKGPSELECNLDTDMWNTDPPSCVKPASSNEVDDADSEASTQKKEQKQNILEDRMVSPALASTLDMSCVQAKVKAPEIRYGIVQKYERRRKGDKVFLTAVYACNDNFDFEDPDLTALYCSNRAWVGDLPGCIPLSEYDEEEEGAYEYEEGDEEDEEDIGEGEEEEEDPRQTNYVAPPPPAPVTEPPTQAPAHTEDVEELSNEIDPVEAEKRDQDKILPVETNTQYNPNGDSGVNEESTQDPYAPRVLDDNCGSDNGGCDQKCERVLFPGENQPRIQCSCGEGFSLDPYDYSTCHDINECELNNGGCEQKCQNLPGSFKCSCESGLQINTLTGNTCIDIDECHLRNGHGPCQDTCHNLWSGYRCSCDNLPGTHLSSDNHTCVDAGECAVNNGGCSHTCLSSLGRIFCLCPPGYRMSGNDKLCEDINECELPEIIEECPTGCENTHGSYRCVTPLNNREEVPEHNAEEEHHPESGAEEEHTEEPKVVESPPPAAPVHCEPGFRVENGQCIDIDECAEGTSGCQMCVNTEGSYECTCPSGYDLAEDEKTCVDIDECSVVAEEDEYAAAYKLCSHGCRNTEGSFVCFCPPMMHLSDDGRTCAPDTCADLENPAFGKTRCSYNCVDLPSGGYECSCPEDYALADTFTCVETQSACERNNGAVVCAPGSCREEQNEVGFSCECPVGYRQENYRCVDVDECLEGSSQCSHQCVNTEGTYICECPEGFFLSQESQHKCVDVNECEVQPSICGSLQCVNFAGSFNCLCEDGSEPNAEGICASMLAPTDPCKESRCSHECVPEGESYRCACPGALQLDESQLNCVESDVCAVNKNGCDHICHSDGSCSCQEGFTLDGNGKTCLDIDECQQNNGGCHQLCTNIAGSYACACESGYQLADDQMTCLDIDECSLGKHDCSHECINVEGGYKCSCPHGYYLGETQSSCVDLNECNAADHGCSHDCYNTVGSYLCACPEGFALSADEMTCVNSLCLENNGGCSHQCDPEQGCSCPPGMILSLDGKTCEDVDECSVNNGGCEVKCLNLPGSYECVCQDGSKPANPGDPCPMTCPAGFTFSREDPTKCEDIDECSLPGVCQYQCRNTNGSYECLCPKGYRLENGRDCADIDECLENNGGCLGGECFNHNGGFECRCPLGQRLAEDRKTCQQVQEMRDHCHPLEAPANGAVHCTKFRHKKKRFYNTRCKVWCNQGFQLEGPSHRHCNASGQWDHHDNLCVPMSCPRLPSPKNGIISPVSCSFGHINVGEECRLKCHVGHVPVGQAVAVCTSQMQWSYNGTFDCVPTLGEPRLGSAAPPPNVFTPLSLPTMPTYPTMSHTPTSTNFNARPLPGFGQDKGKPFAGGSVGVQRPYIKCPRNTTVFLGASERTTHIILQKPITNLDYRYIESSPAWTRDLQAHLGAGTYVVVFRGHDPISGRKARCKTVIHVKHAEGPTIEYCTPSFEVSMSDNQNYRSVKWEEPVFSSKYGPLKKIYKSRLPGELFGLGVHTVYYEATNEDGITAKCEFKIHVNSPGMSQTQLTSNSVTSGVHGSGVPNFQTGPHPGPIFSKPVLPAPMPRPSNVNGPLSRPGMINSPLLAGHESFIICPGSEPIKVTSAQAIELKPNCYLKNVRIKTFRHFMSQRVMPRLWSAYGLF